MAETWKGGSMSSVEAEYYIDVRRGSDLLSEEE